MILPYKFQFTLPDTVRFEETINRCAFLKYHLKESNGIFYSRKLDLINVYPKGS